MSSADGCVSKQMRHAAGAGSASLGDVLHGGDQRYRLCQEVVLGMGGVCMLRALGLYDVERPT